MNYRRPLGFTYLLVAGLCGLLSLTACGGSSGGGDKSWSAAGDDITIDNLVNGSGTSSSESTGKATTSADAAFYFGRFMIVGSDGNLYSGAFKFKLNKQSSSAAYFSDVSLLNFSRADTVSTKTTLVSSATDLNVTAAFNASTNTVSIANATSRFVAFDVAFGNTTAFAPLSISGIFDAGIIFSKDFTSCAGGDDRSFIFIAQKVDAQPDVTVEDTQGEWNAINFSVSSTGSIVTDSTATVSVTGTGGSGGNFRAFTGVNSSAGAFAGEMILNDATSAAFFFGYGATATSTTATAVHGAFIASADKTLVVGYDKSSFLYFAVEKQ